MIFFLWSMDSISSFHGKNIESLVVVDSFDRKEDSRAVELFFGQKQTYETANIFSFFRCGRRSAMETGKPVAVSSQASSSICSSTLSDFSPDLLRIVLSPEESEHCSNAAKVLKQKLRAPKTINDEFSYLEVRRISLPDMEKRCSVALDIVNCKRNRFTDVLPFDDNRVILKYGKTSNPSASDYINASGIVISQQETVSRFIATQAPQRNTYIDFWEMVIQNRCQIIIMLTQSVATYNKPGCEDYFCAEDGPREFGNVCILTKSVKSTGTSLVLRKLEVYYKGAKEPPLDVLHIQYPEWPDYGVPQDNHAIREIFKISHNLFKGPEPIVVHCRAGIGRTGAYCTIHSTIQRILLGDMSALNLADTVTILRSQRAGMVQTQEQFFFCHKAVLDVLKELIAQNSTAEKS